MWPRQTHLAFATGPAKHDKKQAMGCVTRTVTPTLALALLNKARTTGFEVCDGPSAVPPTLATGPPKQPCRCHRLCYTTLPLRPALLNKALF